MTLFRVLGNRIKSRLHVGIPMTVHDAANDSMSYARMERDACITPGALVSQSRPMSVLMQPAKTDLLGGYGALIMQ